MNVEKAAGCGGGCGLTESELVVMVWAGPSSKQTFWTDA